MCRSKRLAVSRVVASARAGVRTVVGAGGAGAGIERSGLNAGTGSTRATRAITLRATGHGTAWKARAGSRLAHSANVRTLRCSASVGRAASATRIAWCGRRRVVTRRGRSVVWSTIGRRRETAAIARIGTAIGGYRRRTRCGPRIGAVLCRSSAGSSAATAAAGRVGSGVVTAFVLRGAHLASAVVGAWRSTIGRWRTVCRIGAIGRCATGPASVGSRILTAIRAGGSTLSVTGHAIASQHRRRRRGHLVARLARCQGVAGGRFPRVQRRESRARRPRGRPTPAASASPATSGQTGQRQHENRTSDLPGTHRAEHENALSLSELSYCAKILPHVCDENLSLCAAAFVVGT